MIYYYINNSTEKTVRRKNCLVIKIRRIKIKRKWNKLMNRKG